MGCTLVAGCGEDAGKQEAAYQSALADADRELTALRNMRAEQQKIFGEHLAHDFEALVWAGEFAPRRFLGLQFGEDEFGKLHLEGKSEPELLVALEQHPVLLQRPILEHGTRAVIARPPERVRELL